MLQCRNIVKDFGGRRLFRGIDWHIRPQDRIGLCGDNGAGKTTLLRLLAGQVEPDAGQVQTAKGVTIGYLPQDGLEHRGRSLFAEARAALEGLLALQAEMTALEHRLAQATAAELERYARLQEEFHQRGGYAMEAEVGKVLAGLGFAESDWVKPCEQFSGGWQMRIALAKLLLRRPNLLLLDEPTNHLDLPARDWLEEYLLAYPYAVVLVSHDRFFLDRVVTRIVEAWNGGLTEYPGNYSLYLTERDRRIGALREEKRRQDEEVERIEAFINRFRYQANKASLVQSRVKQLEKIDRIHLPPERKHIRFAFPDPPRLGRTALELQGAGQRYGGRTILAGVELTIEAGERIALVGPNGAGKSTLMRLLAGIEAPAVGRRLEGHNLHLAYFAQNQAEALDARRTVLEEINADAPVAMVPRLRNILGAFLFSGDEVEKKVAVLSGGERNRLALAKLLLRPANLLLLDEPTNHLDLQSKEVLLEALRGFKGTLAFVSHDRYFVDALASRVLEVGDGCVRSYPGNYEDFLRVKAMEGDASHRHDRVEQRTVTAPVTAEVGGGGSYDEQKSRRRQERQQQKALVEAEGEIERLEAELAELERQLGDPAATGAPERLRQLAEGHGQLRERIAAAYARWEALHTPGED